MFKKITLAFFLIICLTTTNTFAQLDNRLLSNELEVNAKDSNKLFFSFNSLNFIRNTEYFGPIDRGKTWFGYMLNPKLVYYPSSFVRIDVGALFRKDYGNNVYKIIAPTYCVKISKNGYSALFGNYEGAMMHKFIEPLFNIDYAITKPLENGIQFKIDKKRVWSDTWIDWQRMIYQYSPFKEEISAGTTNLFTIVGADKPFKIAIPFQATVHHFGGQIDAVRNLNLSSVLNSAAGLRLSYNFKEGSFVKEIRSDNYYVTYSDISPTPLEPYKSGSGIYLNLLLRTKFINVMASYWDGTKFIAPNGTAIYQSINAIDTNYAATREPHRQLFFVRFFYEKQICKGLNLDVRLEPYYEFSRKAVDYSYSIYLVYKLNAKLGSIHPHLFNEE
jgi:hypothetical protein